MSGLPQTTPLTTEQILKQIDKIYDGIQSAIKEHEEELEQALGVVNKISEQASDLVESVDSLLTKLANSGTMSEESKEG